jgi:hypothetical protein
MVRKKSEGETQSRRSRMQIDFPKEDMPELDRLCKVMHVRTRTELIRLLVRNAINGVPNQNQTAVSVDLRSELATALGIIHEMAKKIPNYKGD